MEQEKRRSSDDRFGALERATNENSRDIASLTQIVKSHESHFMAIEAGLERLAKSADDERKTPWGVVFTGATVMLIVIGMVGSGYVRDLGRVEDMVREGDKRAESRQDQFVGHIKNGHPESVEKKFEEVNRRISEIDEWQKEFDAGAIATHSTMAAEIKALERKAYEQD